MALKQGSGTGKVHFGGLDDVSLYGTPVEPAPPASDAKQGFLRNQLQALFQPTDNKLAMKLFGSKKALMKERIRQKAAGHWVIHPCSSFRSVRNIINSLQFFYIIEMENIFLNYLYSIVLEFLYYLN